MSRLDAIVSREPIHKGWSKDLKYRVVDRSGETLLLRVTPGGNADAKRWEYEQMQQLSALGIPMCQPVEFGVCEEGVYAIQSWIDGVELEEKLPQWDATRQRAYGVKAGQILRQIHSLPAPEAAEPWAIRFGRKIDKSIEDYHACPIPLPDGEAFVRCIEAYRPLIENRPQTFLHGDYHVGNMMVDSSDHLTIIDFNRAEYGDPWMEFNRIVWCAQAAPPFASGLIDGYFGDEIPEAFWQLLALYIARNALSSVVWAIPFGQGEIDTMLNQARDVLNWYDGMRSVIPGWYRKTCD